MPRAQDVFEEDHSVHLVMELCEGGALLERVSSRRCARVHARACVGVRARVACAMRLRVPRVR